MKVDLFDFDLPPECIAQTPAEPRTAAKLLRIPVGGPFADFTVADLADLIAPGDLMVLNDTRVIPARLRGVRPAREGTGNGARIELTLHKRVDQRTWHAFARPAKKLSTGDTIRFAEDFSCRVTEKRADGEVVVAFDSAGNDLDAMLDRHGEMPLPPYIRRKDDADPALMEQDRESYQTAYARHPGAVAAPTAGLHFTDDLFGALDAKGIRRAFVTLHVGAGTFLPVKADDTDDHRMHSEWGEISADTASLIRETRAAGGRIIAVGTTSLRLLESAAPESGDIEPWSGETDIFITPGYRFRAVDRLMTNFHLPKSTLFMLVSAFAGLGRMKAAYGHAIAEGYRFYSYGDACLIDRAT